MTRLMRLPALAASRCLAMGLAIVLAGCASTGSMSPDATTASAADAGQPTSAATEPSPTADVAASQAGNPAAARHVLPGTLGASGAPGAVGSIVVTNPLAPRTLDLTQHADDIWDRVRTGFAIPNIDTPIVAEQQAWYLAHPDYLRRAVDRSSLYLFHVVEELNKRGMPTELALLPFVESAYNPMAYSKAHASGMWQFIPGTGRDYKLKQDWWRDERRDVIASTDAALSYLKTIYEMHGDWHLALASYNWGEGSVKRAIERNQAAGLPTDYLSLPMPDETRNYVPKLQALKNIIANPDAFGVTLPRIDNEPYFVAVERNRDIDVQTAARLANMTLADFKALNPSFNRPVIQGSSNVPLLVPADRANEFRTGLASNGPLATWQAHTVARKETVERIAARYGMTATALREVNGLPPRKQPRPGQALLVQKRGEGDVALRFASFTPPEERGAFVPIGSALPAATYEVKRNDTLVSIARKHGVTPEELRAANHLKGTQVDLGQELRIPRDGVRAVKVGATRTSAAAMRTRSGHPDVRSPTASAPAARPTSTRRAKAAAAPHR